MDKVMKFGRKKTEYTVEQLDDYNVVVKKHYISQAKGHEGKQMEKIESYHPTLNAALTKLSRLQLEDAMWADSTLKKSIKEMKEFYIENK